MIRSSAIINLLEIPHKKMKISQNYKAIKNMINTDQNYYQQSRNSSKNKKYSTTSMNPRKNKIQMMMLIIMKMMSKKMKSFKK